MVAIVEFWSRGTIHSIAVQYSSNSSDDFSQNKATLRIDTCTVLYSNNEKTSKKKKNKILEKIVHKYDTSIRGVYTPARHSTQLLAPRATAVPWADNKTPGRGGRLGRQV